MADGVAIYTNMPAQTGLSQLGDALLRGSGDYANIQLRKQEQQRQLELEQMRRQQALGDLANNRIYEDERAIKGLDRQKDFMLWQQQQARLRELIDKGLLSEADLADEAKVAAADAADTAYKTKIRGEEETYRAQDQAAADSIGEQVREIYEEMSNVQKGLASIPASPEPPDPAAVDRLARQLAATDKKDYKNEAVRLEYQAMAAKQVAASNVMRWQFAQDAAENYRINLNAYNNRLQALNRQLDDYAKKRIVPRVRPPAVSYQPPPNLPSDAFGLNFDAGAGAAPRVATASDRMEAAGGQPPTAAAPGQQAALAAPAMAPAASTQGAIQRVPGLLSGLMDPTIGQRVGGAVRGAVWNHDFSPLKQDPLMAAGNAIGGFLSDLPPLKPLPRRTPQEVFAAPASARGMLQRAGF